MQQVPQAIVNISRFSIPNGCARLCNVSTRIVSRRDCAVGARIELRVVMFGAMLRLFI